jgi:mannan endo-1,6-alpha-mannosidase
MFEACEAPGNCNVDQRSFKGYLSRWMAATTVRAPFTYDALMPLLQSSATAAVKTCTGGIDGNSCGLQWTTGAFDGSLGVGEQMSVLETVQSLLSPTVRGPVSANNGGTSKGDPSGGTGGTTPTGIQTGTITTAEKAGAGILTILVVVGFVGGLWWMIT